MTEPTALDILIAARATVADPMDWGKGMRGGGRRPMHTCCVAEAIEENCQPGSERDRAIKAIYCAIGLELNEPIVDWNDAPERTHSDVICAYNLAIATLSLGAPIRKFVIPSPCKEPA